MKRKFRCKTPCTVNHPIKGQIRFDLQSPDLEVDDYNVLPCEYCIKDKDGNPTGEAFVRDEKGKETKEKEPCPKCMGTKRSFPPHHFVEAGKPEEYNEAEERGPQSTTWETKESLQAELKAMGVPFDGRWGEDQLKVERDKARRVKG